MTTRPITAMQFLDIKPGEPATDRPRSGEALLARRRRMTAMAVAIRLASDRDAAAIADIYAPFVESSATSFETEPPLAEEIRRRVHDTTVEYPWLVCVFDDQVAGFAYATKHRVRAAYQWSVETSVGSQP